MQYAVNINTGTIQNPFWNPGPKIELEVQVVPRLTATRRFHFSYDGLWKRTQWFKYGYPNLFEGDATDATGIRKTERIKFANDLVNLLTYWDQAALKGYCDPDIQNDLTEKLVRAGVFGLRRI